MYNEENDLISEKHAVSRTWIEIDTNAVLDNIEEIKRIIPERTEIMAVVKAGAYGHGAVRIAQLLCDKVRAFGVASLYEALELRDAGIRNDILILGWTSPELFSELVEADVMPAIFSLEDMKRLSETALVQKKRARCYIAVDTGMSRIGFPPTEDGIAEAARAASLDGVCVDGIFSHYACSDEADKTSSALQRKKFDEFCAGLRARGVDIPVRSIDNSAAIMDLKPDCEIVRAGIIIYGIRPSSEVSDVLKLKPVLSLRTRVEMVKTVPAGVGVSYGETFITGKETRIATLCCGYADGIPRLLSNRGDVLIHGKRARILGRVCMDQLMVDISGIDGVAAGDVATVIGRDGDDCITAEEIALHAQTIPYEIICSLDRDRIPKVYIG